MTVQIQIHSNEGLQQINKNVVCLKNQHKGGKHVILKQFQYKLSQELCNQVF